MKQLNAPIPEIERRRRKRLFTRRNFAYAFAVVVAVLALLNIRSEMRDTTGDDFGRLYGGELKKAPLVDTVAVHEADVAPVDEAASADPFSLDAAAREQYLGRPTLVDADAFGAPVSSPAIAAGAANVAIVGDESGVTLVQDGRRAPVLGGGFGRE